MEIRCLASGSTGNCYLVNPGSGWIMLDAGIPLKQVYKHINLNDVELAFISHAHKDHSKSLQELLSKGVKVLEGNLIGNYDKIFSYGKFRGKFRILGVPVQHGEEPNGALIVEDLNSNELLLYATDFNICKTNLKEYKFTRIMVECNYIEEFMCGELAEKENRQINTHMGLNGLIIFLNTLDLSECREIILMHLSQSYGDPIVMGASIYSTYGIKTGVCRQWGGIDYYG